MEVKTDGKNLGTARSKLFRMVIYSVVPAIAWNYILNTQWDQAIRFLVNAFYIIDLITLCFNISLISLTILVLLF